MLRKLLKFVNSFPLYPAHNLEKYVSCSYLYKYYTVSCENSTKMLKSTEFEYPIARRDEFVIDNYHGIDIKDVYRWMEDPDADETKAYVQAQNDITQPFLEDCPERSKINEKLTKLWNFPKYGCPMKHGKYYYFNMNTGLQNQYVMYQQDTLVSAPRVFFDSNKLSSDGTVSLAQTTFSEDGAYMAYGLSESGSDWIKIKIRNVETGQDFDEILQKVKFSAISWTKDNIGFFYGCYPDQDGKTDGSETKQNENQKLYYHRVGTPQSSDELVAEFPEEPKWIIGSKVSDCGNYLLLPISRDTRDNILYYAELNSLSKKYTNLEIKKIICEFEATYDYITNDCSNFYIRTNKGAANYRVIIIDFTKPAENDWVTLIPEHEKNVLDWAKCMDGDKLLLCYIQDVKSALQVNNLNTGKLIKQFNLDIGTIVTVSGKKSLSEIFYSFTSFLVPGIIFRYDFSEAEEEPTVFRRIELNLEGFCADDFKVEQVFYDSKDGTKVPMFIIHKKSNKAVPRPCLVYGYGGFNISLQPFFSIYGLMFIDTFDGVLVYPNIRGGGEYGEKWHNGGRLLKKQNGFDDFQAAARYLIEKKYTSKDRLAIQGGSNGGLLVGACINQKPELYGAAVAQVGVMDMLRFDKFTIGHAWYADYGNPNEKEHFENLLKISPLHNVRSPKSKSEEYPATLILTADHDDRVSPLHSLKFAAALQEAVKKSEFQKKPILLRVYTKAGHGAGKPTSKAIEQTTDILTFLFKSLTIEYIKL